MSIVNPLGLLEDFPVNDTKMLLKNLKADLADLSKDPDYEGEADILLCVIASLDKELANVKTVETLSKEKQARVLADMCLLMQFMEAGEEDFDDEDFDDEDEYEDEDEEDEE